jgi:hypothetical protein
MLGALLSGFIIILAAVPFLGFGWHLIHGSFLFSNGFLIPVPNKFYVVGDVRQPTMWTHTFGTPLFKGRFGMIGIVPRLAGDKFTMENDFEISSARIIAMAQDEGLILRSRRTLSTATNVAFCFEFSEPVGRYGITIRCVIDDTPIMMIYGGDERFLSDFYSTVQGTARTRPSEARR